MASELHELSFPQGAVHVVCAPDDDEFLATVKAYFDDRPDAVTVWQVMQQGGEGGSVQELPDTIPRLTAVALWAEMTSKFMIGRFPEDATVLGEENCPGMLLHRWSDAPPITVEDERAAVASDDPALRLLCWRVLARMQNEICRAEARSVVEISPFDYRLHEDYRCGYNSAEGAFTLKWGVPPGLIWQDEGGGLAKELEEILCNGTGTVAKFHDSIETMMMPVTPASVAETDDQGRRSYTDRQGREFFFAVDCAFTVEAIFEKLWRDVTYIKEGFAAGEEEASPSAPVREIPKAAHVLPGGSTLVVVAVDILANKTAVRNGLREALKPHRDGGRIRMAKSPLYLRAVRFLKEPNAKQYGLYRRLAIQVGEHPDRGREIAPKALRWCYGHDMIPTDIARSLCPDAGDGNPICLRPEDCSDPNISPCGLMIALEAMALSCR